LGTAYTESRAADSRGLDILDDFLDSLPADVRILDAGCGPGGPLGRTVDAVATAIGLDLSREQLALAAETAPTAALLQGDMTALPFEDGVFDAVLAYHSLIHVPLDAHQDVLDEFARVLAPGGRVLVSEGTDEWTGTNPDWLDSGVEMQWEIAGAETTREQLERAGFWITEVWTPTQTFDGDEEQWVFFAAELEG
jgi:ubiquinone/menaquinone biosynthesis C-methylase UbiE